MSIKVIPFILLFLLFVSRFHSRFFNSDLTITFYDIGQGDAALVQLPYGRNLLIDGGGGFKDWDRGRSVLLPELTSLGILSLDGILLSHPDGDHVMGLRTVVRELGVKQFWLSRHFFQKPVPILRELSVKIQPVHKKLQLHWKGVDLEFHSIGSTLKRRNDRSLVVLIRFAGCRLLFTGDLERAGEEELLHRIAKPIDVLKVAHHGSKTSTGQKIAKALSPAVSVISVGSKNRYGHPSAKVVDRLRPLGRVLRTDAHGYVQLKIAPTGVISCRTAAGDCGVFSCHGVQK